MLLKQWPAYFESPTKRPGLARPLHDPDQEPQNNARYPRKRKSFKPHSQGVEIDRHRDNHQGDGDETPPIEFTLHLIPHQDADMNGD